MSFNLDTCRSKDELEAYAKGMFGVDLDKRKKLDELKAQVRTLVAGGDLKTPSEDTTPTTGAPGFVKHHKTGAVFHYQPLLKERVGVDLIPCDAKGNAA